MGNFIGAVITVEKYISKSKFAINITKDSGDTQELSFNENRCYSIPAFQREIRWDCENVNTLLSDLSNSPQFLGNVILANKNQDSYEIIDGQQRTTIISMIFECINKKYNNDIETLDLCQLYNESFTSLGEIISKGFDLSKDELDNCLKTDSYKQYDRIKILWDTINNSEIINDRYKVHTIVNNLKASELNIIYSNSQNRSMSIRHFLDVNLKGVKLDTEDIFKSYLFSQSAKNDIKQLWQDNKRLNIILNSTKNGKADKRYPLMKLYEHYFYCDLYLPKNNGQDFSEVKFGQDFCLTDNVSMGSNIFYKGTHLLETICNKNYLLNSLNRIKDSLTIMIDIAESSGPSEMFKSKFSVSEDKVDFVEISIIHGMLQKILLDKEIIPKVLALKYILSFLDEKDHKPEEYKYIYSVFVASVFFTVFANKKESDTFYSFVKCENWIEKINDWLIGYTKSHDLTRGKLLAAYKYSEPTEDDRSSEFRCKSLAAIYNFIKIKKSDDKIIVKPKNCNDLKEFFYNSEKYSLEHFIIPKSGSIKIKTSKFDFPYECNPQTKKYRNSLFNYIFIPHDLNDKLDNEVISEKLSIIKTSKTKIECQYSNDYLNLIKSSQYFNKYPSNKTIDKCINKEEARQLLDEYFNNEFPNEYLNFSTKLVEGFEF